jgi:TonB family protein
MKLSSYLILLMISAVVMQLQSQSICAGYSMIAISGPDSIKPAKIDSGFVCILYDDEAQPAGGWEGLKKYISESMHYPEAAKKAGAQGRVYIKCLIHKDGSVSDVSVRKDNVGYGCGAEAVRLIKSMPRWTPAKQDGKPVDLRYTIPVIFKLTD